MKKRTGLLAAALCLMLSGCSWLDGSYVFMEPHHAPRQEGQTAVISAVNYFQLMDAMEQLISEGAQSGVIYVPDYAAGNVESGMAIAKNYALQNYPLGAYAVEEIHYELGTNSGIPAVAVTISYRHSLAELQRIRKVRDMDAVTQTLKKALENCDASIVMLVEHYDNKDFSQMVRDYAENYPELVMEIPLVSEGIYGTGSSRMVELIFTYQSSRDSLRQMKEQVTPVFDAAKLYVSGDGAQRQKFSQLYAFLMERFDYKLETSITPSYSLLRHGVGDSRAFATVYASMCRAADLDCRVITGTRSGEPWTWNMVEVNGHYYHVDLLRSSSLGYYRQFTDGEMTGYVWDYSAYPASVDLPAPTEEKEVSESREEETTETTESLQETTEPEATEGEELSLPTEEKIFE